MTRADIDHLLRAGLPDRRIAQQLHLDNRTVAAARRDLGLPTCRPGRQPAASAEDLWRARVEEINGGHMRWTGYTSSSGVPLVRHGGRLHTAYRIAWRIRTGRDPDGYVRPMCGMSGCVAPNHVDDTATRRRNAAAFGAIFDEASA